MRGIEQIPWLYDILCSLHERSGLGEWRTWLVAGARRRVLDLGSGTGRNLPLLPRGTTAVGLDPSLDALRWARKRAPAVPLVAARAEALPFRDGTFDTVLSGLVFCSVGDVSRGLDEVKRVLRPGGQLRMLEHVRSRVPWRGRLQDLIQPAWTGSGRGMPPEPRHGSCGGARGIPDRARRPSSERWLPLLRRSGRQRVVMKALRLRRSARLLVLVALMSPASLFVSPASAGDLFADLNLIVPRHPSRAPEFTAPRLGSGSLSLKELRGQLVFLNFWATWCLPCKEEMPSMERLYQRYKGRGFTIAAISIDSGGTRAVASFVKQLGLTYPIGLDPKLGVANRYTVRALPSSFLIDGKGNTVAIALGPRDWDSVAARAVIESLLK